MINKLSSPFFAAAALVVASSAHAAPATWIGNTDTDWATAANWGTTAPVSGDSLVFGVAGTSGATLTDTLTSSSFNLAGVTFSSGASAYTMSGNDFQLSGAIANNSTALQTINQNITLGANSTVSTVTGGGNVTLGGNLTGAFTLTKSGAGTLTLGGATSSITALAASGGTVTNTGTLTLGNLTGSGSAIINSSGNLTVTGNAIISKASAGTFNQTAGTVNFTAATGGFGLGFNIANTISSNGTYNLSGGTLNVTAVAQITAGGGETGSLNISGGVANMYQIDKATSGSGVGNLTLTGGTLNLGAGGITNSGAGTGTISLGAGTVGASANWSSAQAMALTNSGTGVTVNTLDSVNNTTARTIALSGVLSGAGKLNLSGVGKLTLSGQNTYAGGTVINGGTLNAANNTNGQFALGTGDVSVAGGTLAINDTSVGQLTLGTGASLAMTSGKLTMDITGAATYDKVVGNGTAHFTLTGGTLELTGFGGFEGIGGVGNTYAGLLSNFATTGNSTTGLLISGYDQGNWIASINATNGDLSFSAIAVPEPSTYGLIGAGALAAVAFVRRRRRA